MSEKKAAPVAKRFFVAGTEDLYRRVRVLAALLNAKGVESCAAQLLEEAVARKEAELKLPKR